MKRNSAWNTIGLALLLFAIPFFTCIAEDAVQGALRRLEANCPKSYPEIVTPQPGPNELTGKSDKELFDLCMTSNLPYRQRVCAEIGKRATDGMIPILKEMLASKDWQKQEVALSIFNGVFSGQLANWKGMFPDAPVAQVGQDKIREKFSSFIPLLLPLLKNEHYSVSSAALGSLYSFAPKQKEVIEEILELFASKDEYLAGSAMYSIGKLGFGDASREKILAALDKAMNQPLPNGRGALIWLIAKQPEEFQKVCIPVLMKHIKWTAMRDTMFSESGQGKTLEILMKFQCKELIPLIPSLVERPMRGAGLFEPAIKAAGQFGPEAKSLLPYLKKMLADYEDGALKLEKAGINRHSRGAYDNFKKKIPLLKDAIAKVEK